MSCLSFTIFAWETNYSFDFAFSYYLMEVITDIENINIEKSAVCVGTFDGLHLGHMVVIDKTKEQAKKLNAKSIVFTFWPHPHEVIFPEKQVYYLNTYQEKIELFERSGIDYLVLYPFNKTFANKTSKEFIKDFLVDKLKMKYFVIGYDHQFGKEREGNYEKMIHCAKELDFGITYYGIGRKRYYFVRFTIRKFTS